jgi:hypothetical protein
MLENLDVYLSDSISKVITIRQNGSVVVAPRDIAYFHLEEQDGRLRLYIPKDRKRHHVCFTYTLPRMLLKHLGASSDGSGVELGAIITAPSLLDVDALLEEAGIIELEGVERPDDGNSEELTPPSLPTPDQLQRRASFSTPPVQQERPGLLPFILPFKVRGSLRLALPESSL